MDGSFGPFGALLWIVYYFTRMPCKRESGQHRGQKFIGNSKNNWQEKELPMPYPVYVCTFILHTRLSGISHQVSPSSSRPRSRSYSLQRIVCIQVLLQLLIDDLHALHQLRIHFASHLREAFQSFLSQCLHLMCEGDASHHQASFKDAVHLLDLFVRHQLPQNDRTFSQILPELLQHPCLDDADNLEQPHALGSHFGRARNSFALAIEMTQEPRREILLLFRNQFVEQFLTVSARFLVSHGIDDLAQKLLILHVHRLRLLHKVLREGHDGFHDLDGAREVLVVLRLFEDLLQNFGPVLALQRQDSLDVPGHDLR
mmetsp:Transcript_17151/g.47496  ORF Transcript_17151/g.47496 Transcript_17151/m.47496 type:complete len:314 (-) Transcript_17151:499-1440(-)